MNLRANLAEGRLSVRFIKCQGVGEDIVTEGTTRDAEHLNLVQLGQLFGSTRSKLAKFLNTHELPAVARLCKTNFAIFPLRLT